MKDRIAQNPNRIGLTDENGVKKYYTLSREDNPTQEGTKLCKGTLLSDDTASLLGLTNPTVNEAFASLSDRLKIANGTYYGTGTCSVSSLTSTGVSASNRFRKLNGNLFAFGYNCLYYSTDGITWTSANMNTTVYDIAYGNGKYVCSTGTRMYYSTNLSSWTQCANNSSYCYRNLCFGNGKFLCTMLSNYMTATNVYSYSTDGVTWTQATSSATLLHENLEFKDGSFYTVISKKVYRSSEGYSWTVIKTLSKTTASLTMSDGVLFAVAYNGGAYSTDGATWTEFDTTSECSGYLHSVVKSGGTYNIVASNTNGAFKVFKCTSLTDTTTWELVNSGTQNYPPYLVERMGNTIIVGCSLVPNSSTGVVYYLLPSVNTVINTNFKPHYIQICGNGGSYNQILFMAMKSANKPLYVRTLTTSSTTVYGLPTSININVEFLQNQVIIKSSSAEYQLNESSYTYNYTILGRSDS